jgi:hypothetical protein
MRATWMWIGAAAAITAGALVPACESSGGGADCFPAEHGPSDPSCTGYSLGLRCPVSITPFYTCVCTAGGPDAGADAGSGPAQTWVCAPAGATGTGGGGGGGGSGGSTGSTGDASAE